MIIAVLPKRNAEKIKIPFRSRRLPNDRPIIGPIPLPKSAQVAYTLRAAARLDDPTNSPIVVGRTTAKITPAKNAKKIANSERIIVEESDKIVKPTIPIRSPHTITVIRPYRSDALPTKGATGITKLHCIPSISPVKLITLILIPRVVMLSPNDSNK